MSNQPPLAQLLTISEAHGELWALFVEHVDGTVELHKTDTFKQIVPRSDIDGARSALEDGLTLLSPVAVSCVAAVEAEVELLRDCPGCRHFYDTA